MNEPTIEWIRDRFLQASTDGGVFVTPEEAKILHEVISRYSSPRIEVAFGLGQVAVTLGEHGGRPCVYLAPARVEGKKPGDAVDNASEGLEKHSMRSDESVLTFPTAYQAKLVQKALCNQS